MSFKISNQTSNKEVFGRKLERLRVAHKKMDNPSSTGKKSNTADVSRVSDKLRFELSTLNQKSVELQNDISRGITTKSSLDKLSSHIEELKSNYGSHDEKYDSSILETSQFDGINILDQKEVHTSSNENVEAITTKRPPQIGSYSISIYQSNNESTQEVEYTIRVSNSENYEKSVTTSLIPSSGLISGIEIYFDKNAISESKALEATLEIKESEDFHISNFKKDLDQLSSVKSQDEYEQQANKIQNKIESNQRLIDKDIEKAQIQFQSLQSTSENISASKSANFDLKNAAELVNKTQDSILKSPEASSLLFQLGHSDQTKNLLE